MRVAIDCAGFTAGEADQLRRVMATFKYTGGVSALQGQADRRHGRQRLRARLRRADLQAARGLRQLRLSRKPCRLLRADRLCLVLDEMPASGRLLRGPAQRPADGLLRAGPDRPRRARARRRGPAGLRQRLALGLHAGADRRRRPLRRPARPAHGARASPMPMPPRSSRPAPTSPSPRSTTSGAAPACRRPSLVQLAEADAFRPALSASPGARRCGRSRRCATSRCRCSRPPRPASSRPCRRSTSRPSRCGR